MHIILCKIIVCIWYIINDLIMIILFYDDMLRDKNLLCMIIFSLVYLNFVNVKLKVIVDGQDESIFI